MFSEHPKEEKDGAKETDPTVQNENLTFIDDKALRIMQKMGYKTGSGLGKTEQGITEAIDIQTNLGKRGLGLTVKIMPSKEDWDFSKEEVVVQENFTWLSNDKTLNCDTFNFTNMTTWMKEGPPNHRIENETRFCDENIVRDVINAKNIFEELDATELNHARTRANVFETIRSMFFMNRAALKMANIDAATGHIFTKIDRNKHHVDNSGPYYFADVCAGPGGFTEYILWRKGWRFKGFGITLRDEQDFKVYNSNCASPATFQPLYGADADGNVCSPANIHDFKHRVLHETDGKGVHFMMSDGGFSVQGNENLQEILSKNIYISQCLVALEIVRPHGHFVTKLFDLFTIFSVGLLYLMYNCFEKVTIIKPNSSRPANAERYFVCYGLKNRGIVEDVKKYLRAIVRRLWEVKQDPDVDVLEIVPLDVIKRDADFFSFIVNCNNYLGAKQIVGLQKLAAFCRNPSLIEPRQETMRKKCLELWEIPDWSKIPRPQLKADALFNLIVNKQDIALSRPREINMSNFHSTLSDFDDWHYCPLYASKKFNNCNFYICTKASKVYRLQHGKWTAVKNVHLVNGTLIYAELVKEYFVPNKNVNSNSTDSNSRHSLHVIDALRLGDTNLTDLKFQERMDLIRIYCKAVNKESTPYAVRIRPKTMKSLLSVSSEVSLKEDRKARGYVSKLPVLGYNVFSEEFRVNSLLLLKTTPSHTFYSTFVLRVQLFISIHRDQDEEGDISLSDVLAQLAQK